MVKILGMVAVLGAIIAGTFGSAAVLEVDGTTIQVGDNAESLACDTDGVYVFSYQYNDNDTASEGVTGVTLKGVSGNCEGARMGFRLDDGSNNVLAYSSSTNASTGNFWAIVQASEPAAGYNFTTVAANRTTPVTVDAALIEKIHVWIEGDDTP